eukprot:497446-Amphidinium_carterae.1
MMWRANSLAARSAIQKSTGLAAIASASSTGSSSVSTCSCSSPSHLRTHQRVAPHIDVIQALPQAHFCVARRCPKAKEG